MTGPPTTLLTGGTGFLGSHLAEAIVAAGHRLRCTVRPTSDTRWLDPLGVETVTLDLAAAASGDARGRAGALGALRGVGTLVHCGALTRARTEAEFMAVNATGTETLARTAVEAGVRRIVFISSLAARGPDGAAGPISPYGRSKAAAERALTAMAREADGSLELVILRPGGVYGPRDSDLLPLFRLADRGWVVVPRSRQPLQPVFVADVVTATVAALDAAPPPAPLPVAHPARHGWDELGEALRAAVGRSARLVRVPGAVFWTAGLVSEAAALLTRRAPAMDRRRARDMSHHRWTCDIAETRAWLGWEPRVDVREGMARTAAWYREAGWL